MYLFATFEHSLQLNLAIDQLELYGMKRDELLIVPLCPKMGQRQLFDTIHRSDGIALVNTPSILATVLSVFGTIYGFVLPGGPIIWGLLGIVAGWAIGLTLNILIHKKRMARKRVKTPASEVVLLIHCQIDKIDAITKTLYDHNAIGIGTFKP